MKKKIVLMSLMIVALFCTFAVSAFATEFTVATEDEFDDAYSQAQDGDTIVITADVSAQFNFGKTITYILDGGVKWSAKGGYGTNMCDATGKTVRIYARNGNGIFYPASGMWFNNTGTNTTNDLSSTTFSLGSLDNSKLTLDCSAFTASNSRMFYDATLKEFNLLSGVVVTNLNVVNPGSCYIHAKTVNMYEGAEIYGNKMTNYTAIIRADAFNMYGGKVYGNYLGCYGLSQSGSNKVFGGEIFDNYITGAANSGVPSALLNAKSGSQNGYFEIYSGTIKNNLLLYANAERQALLCAAGGSHITSGVYFDNYETADWGEEPTKVNGIYTSVYDVNNASESTIQGYYTTAEYSVIFKNSDGSVINAYMINNGGSLVKAYDGSTEITVPESQSGWTTKANYCVNVTPVTDKQGVYYISVPHAINDDYNCETALSCSACAKVLEKAREHTLIKTIAYEKGYLSAGLYFAECTNDGCNHTVSKDAPALFTCLGYSAPMGGEMGIAIGFTINNEAVAEYEATGKSITFGVYAVAQQRLGENDIFDENGNATAGVINADLTGYSVDAFEIKIVGFNDTQKDIKLSLGAYVTEDGKTYSYLQSDKAGELVGNYYAVTYNSVIASLEANEVTQ